MSDSKHERDGRAESVRALMLIRESCADVDAWQVWAANGDLVEAYPNELLDHITDLTQRSEEAEAERKEALDSLDKSRAFKNGLLIERNALRAENDGMHMTNLRIMRELAEASAECDALRKDAALLDALQAEHERFDPVAALVVKVKHDRNSSDWANITGDIRAALTAAMAVQP